MDWLIDLIWLIDGLLDWLIDWLMDGWMDGLIDWLIWLIWLIELIWFGLIWFDWLIDWFIDWIDGLIDWCSDNKTVDAFAKKNVSVQSVSDVALWLSRVPSTSNVANVFHVGIWPKLLDLGTEITPCLPMNRWRKSCANLMWGEMTSRKDFCHPGKIAYCMRGAPVKYDISSGSFSIISTCVGGFQFLFCPLAWIVHQAESGGQAWNSRWWYAFATSRSDIPWIFCFWQTVELNNMCLIRLFLLHVTKT